MKIPEELFEQAQEITIRMSQILDTGYSERIERSIWISKFKVCSIRVRKSGSGGDTFHVISECLIGVNPNFATKELAYNQNLEFKSIQASGKTSDKINKKDLLERYPYHVITFEHAIQKTLYDVSLGFIPLEYEFMLQPKGCFDCGSEEFCSQQIAAKDWEEFNYADEIRQIMEIFASEWAQVLADFAHSFGVKFMYKDVPYILDQVYDSWDQIPNELESTYSDFLVNKDGNIYKNPDLCSKDECDNTADEGGMCYLHEDLCRISDCFDYRVNGPYCDDHPDD